MTIAVSATIARAQRIVNDYDAWFEAVAAWYDCAKWTKIVFVNYLCARNRPAGKIHVRVNQQDAESCRDHGVSDANPTWWIPAGMLHDGENELILRFDGSSKPSSFEDVRIDHFDHLTERSKFDLRPETKSTAQLAAAMRLGAGFRQGFDHWHVQIDGRTLRFVLKFGHGVPSGFVCGLSAKLPKIGYSLILEDLWDQVADLIKDKVKQLVKEYYQRLQRGDRSGAQQIADQLRDLRNYLELHETHLAHAISADDSATLEQLIDETRTHGTGKGKPTRVEPTLVEPIDETPTKERSRRPEPKRSIPRKPAQAHWFFRLVRACFFITMLAGAGAAAAWYFELIPPERIAQLNQWIDGGGDLDGLLRRQGAQTGDVQISLQWFNKNDLDLHVIAPSGEVIHHGMRASRCQGKLDVDMNVNYATASMTPVENVFWPVNAAPKGRYRVRVVHFRNHGQPNCQDPTRYSVRVLVRGQATWLHGELVNADPARNSVIIHEFEVR